MDQTIERWRPVPGWEGFYEVSDHGRVRSLDRWVVGQRRRYWPGKVLTPWEHSFGYLSVTLAMVGRMQKYTVHRLVLLAFVWPPPEGTEACHWNGDPTDNALANLRWDARARNADDRCRHGTQDQGEAHGWAKLTAEQVRAIRQRYAEGDILQRELAALYGVTHQTVSKIVRGDIWRYSAEPG